MAGGKGGYAAGPQPVYNQAAYGQGAVYGQGAAVTTAPVYIGGGGGVVVRWAGLERLGVSGFGGV